MIKLIHLKTRSQQASEGLARNIIKNAKNQVYKTWDYELINLVENKLNYDSIYHNPPQYVDNPDKHVWFIIGVDDTDVILKPVITEGYELTDDLASLHTGRLLEMLMKYHYNDFTELSVR